MADSNTFSHPTFGDMCEAIVPACESAGGASDTLVLQRLQYIYEQFRPDEIHSLRSIMEAFIEGNWIRHPYFQTFAETVTEAYWTSKTGMDAVGFSPAKKT